MNKTDYFELKFSLKARGESSQPGALLLKQSVYINEVNISPDSVIDLTELIACWNQQGKFNVVTCECGEA
ncbi:MAG: hypothetical protein V4629_00275 [Pseudomonadota bacterium]